VAKRVNVARQASVDTGGGWINRTGVTTLY
jgi:hypothetical protein